MIMPTTRRAVAQQSRAAFVRARLKSGRAEPSLRLQAPQYGMRWRFPRAVNQGLAQSRHDTIRLDRGAIDRGISGRQIRFG
jgi:hypothetical protein